MGGDPILEGIEDVAGPTVDAVEHVAEDVFDVVTGHSTERVAGSGEDGSVGNIRGSGEDASVGHPWGIDGSPPVPETGGM